MSSWITHHKLHRVKKELIYTNSNFKPSFHILIATGGRFSLKNMLKSLENELNENDAITIIFDGEDALKSSSYNDSWIINHKCKINIIEQIPNLGYWGHGIRNKYQELLKPKTTFIMNADDDDVYIPGSFNKLRTICIEPDTLYIVKFLDKNKNIIIPSQNLEIIKNDIGTPCGIIPFDIAGKSIWEYKYGGDFSYYDNIKKNAKQIKFLDIVIYHVL
jgi:hypothetical protein